MMENTALHFINLRMLKNIVLKIISALFQDGFASTIIRKAVILYKVIWAG